MNATIGLAAAVDQTHRLASQPMSLFLAIGVLSIAPFVVLLMTSFVKISLVLSILKSAMGAAQIPPSQVITGLSLVLTIYVMAPTGERMYRAVEGDLAHGSGIDILSGRGIEALSVVTNKAKEPLREFLLKHASGKDRSLFYSLSLRMRGLGDQSSITDRDFLVVVPAFLSSELRRAFEIGFLLLIPFLVVDLVIANLLTALGMHMLSPTSVSLPFKLLLFVLADGWQLLLRGLIESYV